MAHCDAAIKNADGLFAINKKVYACTSIGELFAPESSENFPVTKTACHNNRLQYICAM